MGISVTHNSTLGKSASGSEPAAASLFQADAPIDFAAILTGQISGYSSTNATALPTSINAIALPTSEARTKALSPDEKESIQQQLDPSVLGQILAANQIPTTINGQSVATTLEVPLLPPQSLTGSAEDKTENLANLFLHEVVNSTQYAQSASIAGGSNGKTAVQTVSALSEQVARFNPQASISSSNPDTRLSTQLNKLATPNLQSNTPLQILDAYPTNAQNVLAIFDPKSNTPSSNLDVDSRKDPGNQIEPTATPNPNLIIPSLLPSEARSLVEAKFNAKESLNLRPIERSPVASTPSVFGITTIPDKEASTPEILNSKSNLGSDISSSAGRLEFEPLPALPLEAPGPAIVAGEPPASESSTTPFSGQLVTTTNTVSQSQSAPETASTIRTPIDHQQWGKEFGDRIVWLAKSDQQSAQISINPPQLGPVQITLNLNGDQASALFASPHAEVRQAIQDALPQLREMLSSAGISLGQANVGAQLPQQNRDPGTHFADTNRSSGENAILSPDNGALDGVTGISPIQRGLGLVDLFA